jgi:hypothetical protein
MGETTKAKKQGDLSFRDFRVFNQALLACQAWRLIVQPDSLCARVLKRSITLMEGLRRRCSLGMPHLHGKRSRMV